MRTCKKVPRSTLSRYTGLPHRRARPQGRSAYRSYVWRGHVSDKGDAFFLFFGELSMKPLVMLMSASLAALALSGGLWASDAHMLDPAWVGAAKTPMEHEAVAKAYDAEALGTPWERCLCGDSGGPRRANFRRNSGRRAVRHPCVRAKPISELPRSPAPRACAIRATSSRSGSHVRPVRVACAPC